MSYTPVFRSIYDGSLFGRWPTAAVWATILPLVDRHGRLDMSPAAISGLTGWPLELLERALQELEQPDPMSRSASEGGRRLLRIDPARPWGWLVVNHAAYAERARKRAYDSLRTASGQDAERKRRHRLGLGRVPACPDVSRRVPPCPDTSRQSPLSTATATSTANKEKAQRAKRAARGSAAMDLPADLDRDAWERWLSYRREIGKPLKPASFAAAAACLAALGADQREMVERSVANGWLGVFPRTRNGGRGDAAAGSGSEGARGEAMSVWDELIESNGAKPSRDARIQHALDAAGGWQAIRGRTPSSEPQLREKFCRAYAAFGSLGSAKRDARPEDRARVDQ